MRNPFDGLKNASSDNFQFVAAMVKICLKLLLIASKKYNLLLLTVLRQTPLSIIT